MSDADTYEDYTRRMRAAGELSLSYWSWNASGRPTGMEELKQALGPPLRPRNSAERKGEPIHSGVMLYFPDALAAVARLSKRGNDKHNPGEPLHWARGKSMDQMDASARHMLTLSAIDPETDELEAVANAWRALAELQLLEEARLKAAGIMPYSGIVP